MKNTKLIALVAVLVVVGVIVSVIITNGTIGNTKHDVEVELDKANDKIAELNTIIEKLNAGLITYEQAMKDLEAKGIEIKNWTDATNQLPTMLAKLEKTYADFQKAETVFAEDGKTVVVTFDEKYAYEVLDAEGKVAFDSMAIFGELAEEAEQALCRATSVSEMESIIKAYKADLEAVPTMLERLYTAIETAEKGGVTYDDYDNLVLAYDLLNEYITNDNVYAPAKEGEKKGEKELLSDRLDDLYVEFKPIVVAKFVELVNALPEVAQLAPSHEKALKAAQAELEFVKELYTADQITALKTKNNKTTAFGKAVDTTLPAIEARWSVIEGIVAHAEQLNKLLKDAFSKNNAFGFDTTKYGANSYTHTHLANVKAQITTWETVNSIITDKEDEDYNEELYNLVNRSVYEGYEADFAKVCAELKGKVDAFIGAVDAIENVNLDSKKALDAAKALFDIASKGLTIEEIDTILELNDTVDEEGEPVEVTGLVDSYNAWLTLYHDYNWLADTKKALEDEVKAALIVCKVDEHGKKDEHGDIIKCDCENIGKYDYTKITTDYDDAIVRIFAQYGLDETVFDATLLAQYKVARIQDTLAAVMGRVDAAYAASTDARRDTLKGVIYEEILGVAADYTFAAKFTCVDPDNKNHECECAKDLANWALDIAGEPAEELDAKYTQAILNNRFFVVETPVAPEAPEEGEGTTERQ